MSSPDPQLPALRVDVVRARRARAKTSAAGLRSALAPGRHRAPRRTRAERLRAPRATPRGQGPIVGLWLSTSLLALGCAGPAKRGTSRPDALLTIQPSGEERGTRPATPGDSGALKHAAGDERITRAIDVLDDCPEAGIAFHTRLSDEGPEGVLAAQEHAVTLQPDGSVTCGDMRLGLPGVGDARLLRFHVTEIERVTGRPAEVWLARDSGSSALKPLLVDLASPPLGVRRVDFLFPQPDGSTERMPYAFSEPMTEEEAAAALWVRVEALEQPGGGQGRFYRYSFRDPGGRKPPAFAWTLALGPELEKIRGRAPDLRVIIDARPGTDWAEAKAVLDLVVAAGFTDIHFAAERR